jgi:hypothetical protein
MSLTKKIAVASVAALAMGAVLTTGSEAQARPWGLGLGIGLAAGAVVGAAIASSRPYYGPAYVVSPGYRTCHWVRQFDAYGNYVGKSCVY